MNFPSPRGTRRNVISLLNDLNSALRMFTGQRCGTKDRFKAIEPPGWFSEFAAFYDFEPYLENLKGNRNLGFFCPESQKQF
jgi:hypothetical protein